MQTRVVVALNVLLVAALLPLGGCAKKKKNDTGTVAIAAQGLTVASTVSLKAAGALLDTPADPAAANVSFTPTSVMVPIRSIIVSPDGPGPTASASVSDHDGEPGGVAYSCSAAAQDDCDIDVADEAALKKLTASATLTVGQVLTIGVNACSGAETGAHVKIKGSVEAAGTTYYTTSGPDPLSTDATKNDYTSISIGCALTYVIPNGGFQITAGGTETVTLEFTTAFLSTGAPTKNGASVGGCVNGATSSVCSAYPDIVPYLGTTGATADSFLVEDTATSTRALIDVVLDGTGNPIGAFARGYQDGTGLAFSGVMGPAQSFSKNADGTYKIQFYPTGTGVAFPSFEMTSAAGTMTAADGSSVAYTSKKQ